MKIAWLTLGLLLSMGVSAAQSKPMIEQKTFNDWTLICSKQSINDELKKRCQMVQTLSITQQEKTQRIIQASVIREAEQRLLEVIVPLGVDLRPGLLLQIDEGEVGTTPYLRCDINGCFALVNMNDSLWEKFQSGKTFKVAIKGIGQTNNTVFSLSLKGTRAAARALMKP